MARVFDELKKQKLKNVLRQFNGNRTLAAEKLDISVRTIRNWIKKYDLVSSFPPVRGRKQTRDLSKS